MELTIQEAIVLNAIFRLGEDAYGVSIRKESARLTGKKMMYGTLYNTLHQLLRKGYVEKTKGEPTAERGGRSKMFYRLTTGGVDALRRTRELHLSLWEGIPELRG